MRQSTTSSEDKWLLSGRLTKACVSPDRDIHGVIVERETGPEHIRIDVAFPVLHGKNGEDGTVQGLFQLAGIPFVGCDMTSSAVSMDKIFTNTVADENGMLSGYCFPYPDILQSE